ncbi:MAG: 50S ribosomal protein L25 [Candidatus Omnitrophota bacterium]|nr:50S ribosomal protein L25 [Candidatus Omnitrophota bacterium]
MKQQKVERVHLEAVVRTALGKGKTGRLRQEGLVPAVVYREGGAALAIQVPGKELSRILRVKGGENALIALQFGEGSKEGLKGHPTLASGENVVLIKELQHHPVSSELLHVDFHQISLTKKITVSVPLSFKGEAAGVRLSGGVLEHLRWELEVECLPTEIPAEIPVEISGLELGKTLHVKDIPLPAGVRAVTDAEQPVVACVEPQKEAVATPAEEAGAVTEPEVIKQKKPEEEGAAPAEGGKEKAKAEPKAEAKKG